MRIKIGLILAAMIVATGIAYADTITLSGRLNDQTNSALVGSDLGAALFGDDYEIANNVAIYDVSVPMAGVVTFTSLGFGLGGVDPYFTLFSGTGTSATFLGSNYDQAFTTGGDFILPFTLAAGNYAVAIGVFANMSFNENLGSGTLGDGFTQLGGPGYLGDYYYELRVDYPTSSVPEPSTWLLVLPGIALILLRRSRA